MWIVQAANVLLKSTAADPRGFTCKLADFGMARLLETNRTHVSTHTYGTISYMPPELLREGKLTRAVDAFSFAILMWELFSGEMLHAGLTVAQVSRMFLTFEFRFQISNVTLISSAGVSGIANADLLLIDHLACPCQ